MRRNKRKTEQLEEFCGLVGFPVPRSLTSLFSRALCRIRSSMVPLQMSR